jgi:dTDP-4-dehydrorhamnose reductase
VTFLIFGADGQVGHALRALIPHESVGVDIKDCDIRDEQAVAALVAKIRPTAIVNCAAYTAVDRAEADREMAFAVNATGPGNIARAAASLNVPVLHISTDYVYAGTGHDHHQETDPIAPKNVYGASKAAGDDAVARANPRHIILRVSWVFSAIGNNFVKTMLRLGRERPELSIVDDQIGGPTEARDIAETLLTIARRCVEPGFAAWGLYHYAGAPAVSWRQFAQAIFETSRGSTPALKPIPTSAYPLPASRPLNSRLDCGKLHRTFGIAQPDWRVALARVVAELESAQ